jgi:hypothetical protein
MQLEAAGENGNACNGTVKNASKLCQPEASQQQNFLRSIVVAIKLLLVVSFLWFSVSVVRTFYVFDFILSIFRTGRRGTFCALRRFCSPAQCGFLILILRRQRQQRSHKNCQNIFAPPQPRQDFASIVYRKE